MIVHSDEHGPVGELVLFNQRGQPMAHNDNANAGAAVANFNPDRVREHLAGYMKAPYPQLRQCPLCGNFKWSFPEAMFELRPAPTVNRFGSASMVLPDNHNAAYPVLPVTCTVCGYTFLIHALGMPPGTAAASGLNVEVGEDGDGEEGEAEDRG